VCHLNEGHAALVVLERARSFMKTTGQSFEVALSVTRAGNLFTTHTAVAVGFDRFAPALIEQCLGGYARKELGITLLDLLALGRQNPNDPAESFNMAYLAIRGSGAVNGVSRLHGEVSRRLFEPLFPRWPAVEVPVGHVTNGVHMPSWDSAAADALWTKACGKDRWLGTTETLEQDIRRVSDVSLWQFRSDASMSLIEYARERLSRQLAASGASPEAVEGAKPTSRKLSPSSDRCTENTVPKVSPHSIKAPRGYSIEPKSIVTLSPAARLTGAWPSAATRPASTTDVASVGA
jgi:starch phosphorylase